MSTVSAVRLTPVAVPRRTGLVCGHVVVEIETQDGVVGIGEMSDLQHLPRFHPDVGDLERTLQAMLVGLHVEATNELATRLGAAFPSAGHLYDKGAVIRCGVDIAWWDLRGKLAGRSVTELLGGSVRGQLPVAYPIFRARTRDDVAANVDVVAERLEQGFSLFRFYVGGDAVLDETLLRAVRDRWGDDVGIKSLDFSNLLDSVAAARFVERTRDIGYDLIEAPAREGDVEGLADVRRRTLLPVSEHVYDGASALRLVSHRAVDVLNVGLFALGGITPALAVTALADAAGLACLVGTTQELGIGTAAAVHLGVSCPSTSVAADPVGPLLYTDDVVAVPLDYTGGALGAPEGPGLGVDLDRDAVARLAAPLTWQATSVAGALDRVGARP